MSRTEHNSVACRTSRHRRATHLIAADEQGLAELEALVATLPLCATGRVFVEVADAADTVRIAVPPRMTLTVLPRSRHRGLAGTGRRCGRGDALVQAVTAWADEMLCGEEPSPRINLLAGFVATADIVDHLTERCQTPTDAISTPAHFGLTTAH